MRFDEVELEAAPAIEPLLPEPVNVEVERAERPSIIKRSLALLTDLSLFAALALALSPLLPNPTRSLAVAALAGFVLMISFYYFVGAWMVWGRTIGGAVFDVRTPTQTLGQASRRWALLVVAVVVVYSATLTSLALAFPA